MGTPFPALSLAETSIIPSFCLCTEEWNVMELCPHPAVVHFHLLPRDIGQALTFEGLVNEFKSIIIKRTIFTI